MKTWMTAGREFLYCTGPGKAGEECLLVTLNAIEHGRDIEYLVRLLLIKSRKIGLDDLSIVILICLLRIPLSKVINACESYTGKTLAQSPEFINSSMANGLKSFFAEIRKRNPEYAAIVANSWIFMIGYYSG